MIKNTLIEVCCGSIEDVALASQFPVDRIELNSALELGGLTPSMGTLKQAVQCSRLPICCMVRPRNSGFHYTEDQFDSMCFDAEMLISGGAAGIVWYKLYTLMVVKPFSIKHLMPFPIRMRHAKC